MSHFTVMVVGEDVDEQLAPFQENNMGDCPEEYMEFTIECEAGKEKEYIEDQIKDMTKKEHKKYLLMTVPEFMEKWNGYTKDKDGNWGYYSNPNSKWDWYVIGGRWAGFWKLKPGRKGELGQPGVGGNKPLFDADQARKKDIDFEAMKRIQRKEAETAWRKIQEKLVFGTEEDKKGLYWEYGYHDGMTEEDYMKTRCNIATFAVIKDGKWYEKGEMGWFGMSSNEKDSGQWEEESMKLIESLDEDTMLTIVDCHI